MRRVLFFLLLVSVVSLLLIPYSVLAEETWTLYLSEGGDEDNPTWNGVAQDFRLSDFKEGWTFEVRVTNTHDALDCSVSVSSEAFGHIIGDFPTVGPGSSVTLEGEGDDGETGIELFCRCLDGSGDYSSITIKYTAKIWDADGDLVGGGGMPIDDTSGTCCTAAYIGAAAGAVVLLAAAYGLLRKKQGL